VKAATRWVAAFVAPGASRPERRADAVGAR